VLFELNVIWSNLLGLSGVLSIILGSISALYQKRIKRLFAYSTIAHTGFILLTFLSCSFDSVQALIFYIVIYSLLTVLLFSALINISVATANSPKYLIALSAMNGRNYLFAISFSLIVFAIAGIPPLIGFFSKFFVLFSLIGAQYYITSFIVILFSSIACFYYIRLIKIVLFAKHSKNVDWITNNSKKNTEFVLGLLLTITLCYFLRPNLFIDYAIVTSLSLF
jgi:NADH:ubiquinone oxidoreductase subunit 2 (subunit N)